MDKRLKSATTFLFDLDGTLYLDGKLFEGADDTIRRLRKHGKQVFFLTNNSSRSRADYQKKLNDLGIRVFIEEIITSGVVTAEYIIKNYPDKSVYLFGTQSLKEEFLSLGIKLREKSDLAVMGYHTQATYEEIYKFATLIKDKTIPYICTHSDINCPSDSLVLPDCGSFIELFYKSTKRLPDIICGKPNKIIYEYIKERAAGDIVMTGDRLYTDTRFAHTYGFFNVLVLSGETKKPDLEKSDILPDLVMDSIKDFLKFFG